MANKSTATCTELSQKLIALYAHVDENQGLEPRVTGPSALAEATGIGRTTIHKWRKGNADANRAIWQVSPKHVAALAALLHTLLPERFTVERSLWAWRHATAVEFKRSLVPPIGHAVTGVLEGRPATLAVACAPVKPSLNMVEVDIEPIEGEIELASNQPFGLQAGTRAGRTLVVLGEGPNGWFLLAPAPEFSGKVERAPQRFPTNIPGWRISQTNGPHRIVVIELPTTSAPIGRKRGQALTLLPEQERLLVEELLDVDRSGEWAWGEARLFVQRPKSDG